MHVIEAQNVRDALPQAVEYLVNFGLRETTRLGEVLSAPHPVAIRYRDPKQHVLLNPVRNANPFFHLMESMWMLAGREDGAFLDNYIKDFSKMFGNASGIIPDAYGYRWRYGLWFNQLDELITQLRNDPTTRQCVLQMWGVGQVTHDLLVNGPKPCNLVTTFRIIDGKLDMSVFNRSNDVIWGCCGANAVHFPILQEYIAGKVGVEIGRYWQISTNLHLYRQHINSMLSRTNYIGGGDGFGLATYLTDYSTYEKTQPLMTYPTVFDEELRETMGWLDDLHQDKEINRGNISNRFLSDVVLPMALAYRCFKNKDMHAAYRYINEVSAEDWYEAGKQWLDRRYHA